MTNKTALEWFKQLPEPYRTQAIQNSQGLNTEYESPFDALRRNFNWASTPQGGIHWLQITNRAELGEFDPIQVEIKEAYQP